MLSLQSKQYYIDKLIKAKNNGALSDTVTVSRIQRELGLCYDDSLSVLTFGVGTGVLAYNKKANKCAVFI